MPSRASWRWPGLEPALRARARASWRCTTSRPGRGVSYGGLWRAARPVAGRHACRSATPTATRATCAAPRCCVGGRRVPIVGAVCMDMLMIDVTDLPAVGARTAPVTLIGRDGAEEITVDDLARWAGTISYEILCGISKRVPRVLRDAPVTPPAAGAAADGARHDRRLFGRRRAGRPAGAPVERASPRRCSTRRSRPSAVILTYFGEHGAAARRARWRGCSAGRSGCGCSSSRWSSSAWGRCPSSAGRVLLGRGLGAAGDRRAAHLQPGAVRRRDRRASRWRRSWRRCSPRS